MELKGDETTIYVGGFDRHLAFEDLEAFLFKYGKIKRVHRQYDQVIKISFLKINNCTEREKQGICVH